MITIKTTSGRGDFVLYENDEPVISLRRTNWYSSRAETVYFENLIEIIPKNFWGKKFDILENGDLIGDIAIGMGWKSEIKINISGQNYKEHRFTIQRKGFLKFIFELYDSSFNHILTLYPRFNWSKFRYDYTVSVRSWGAHDLDIYELLTYCVYAINMYINRRNGTK